MPSSIAGRQIYGSKAATPTKTATTRAPIDTGEAALEKFLAEVATSSCNIRCRVVEPNEFFFFGLLVPPLDQADDYDDDNDEELAKQLKMATERALQAMSAAKQQAKTKHTKTQATPAAATAIAESADSVTPAACEEANPGDATVEAAPPCPSLQAQETPAAPSDTDPTATYLAELEETKRLINVKLTELQQLRRRQQFLRSQLAK